MHCDETHSTGFIADEHWPVYCGVMRAAKQRNIPYALGGALAVAHYTGRWRWTKDLDLYVMPADRERMLEVFADQGLADYFDKAPYDRGWIYRGNVDDIIVDMIWGMPNRRAEVDLDWVTRGSCMMLNGEPARVLPPEELIWAKIYVLQRDRSDWPDILNLISAVGRTLDWERLLARLQDDAPLLTALLSILRWLQPSAAHNLPRWIWGRLNLPEPERPRRSRDVTSQRAGLLDTREWFAPAITD